MTAIADFQNPPDEEIRELLLRARSIAVVGLSPRKNRPSHGVAAQWQRFGYRIIEARLPAPGAQGDSLPRRRAPPFRGEAPSKGGRRAATKGSTL